jgi:hypothetical protein
LRQISTNCESASSATTKRKEIIGSRLLEEKDKKSRLELRPFEVREKQIKRRESSETEDTFELIEELGIRGRKGKVSYVRKEGKERRGAEENKENLGKLQYG